MTWSDWCSKCWNKAAWRARPPQRPTDSHLESCWSEGNELNYWDGFDFRYVFYTSCCYRWLVLADSAWFDYWGMGFTCQSLDSYFVYGLKASESWDFDWPVPDPMDFCEWLSDFSIPDLEAIVVNFPWPLRTAWAMLTDRYSNDE